MPRFSIVIPTRNRANLLDYALRSALTQTYDDYEVIVSNNHCEDHTDQVVARRACDRLRLVHTGRVLPMHAHWNFAWRLAGGEYVCYLCDDDAWHPRLLETLAQALDHHPAELVTWGRASYVHPHWHDVSLSNRLTFGIYANRARIVATPMALKSMFGLDFDSLNLPLMLNTACRRSIIEKLAGEMGGVFQPTSPDYSAVIALLSAVDEYVWLDAPLMLAGIAPESIGVNATASTASVQAFMRELEQSGTRWVETVPLQQQSDWNSIADTILRMRARIPALVDYDLDWPRYFAGCRRVLGRRAALGGETRADREEYAAELSRRSPEFRQQVEQQRAALDCCSPPLALPELDQRLLVAPVPCFVPPADGKTVGFGDIVAAAATLETWVPEKAVNPNKVADFFLATVRARRNEIRRVVLYGLGQHGVFLWRRLVSSLESLGVELYYEDDRLDDPERIRFPLSRCATEWEETFVIVSPWQSEKMAARLTALGGQHGRDWLTWKDGVSACRRQLTPYS